MQLSYLIKKQGSSLGKLRFNQSMRLNPNFTSPISVLVRGYLTDSLAS